MILVQHQFTEINNYNYIREWWNRNYGDTMNEGSFEDSIRVQALIDNTAQGIFNHLKEIENKREIYEKRWIWELLQNALDAAPLERKIEVEIIKKDNQLTFIHNGRPFKPEEVAHLIYHGSTKKEKDIGKFGTGFLITHLLSRKVNVKGVREDGKNFKFMLDRDGGSFEEIKNLMENTWKIYQNSLGVTEKGTYHTAEFEYSLNDISLNTVEAGIRELIKIAPFVLAFNDKLGAIKIIDQADKVKFELVNEINEAACVNKVVKEEWEGKPPRYHELWIAKDDDVEIAIRGKKQDDGTCQVETLQDIPKIFLAFPLFGTQDLPFPVVVNSRKFEPTDKRDGIFLGRENTEDIKQNKRLLEKASELFSKLISDSDFSKWENIHILLSLGIPPEKDWLDKDWYIGLLKRLISEKIINARILKTKNGKFIPLKEGFIPVMEDPEKEKMERWWDVCCCFSAYKDKIPLRDFAFEWANIFNEWKSLGLNLTEREVTIVKLADEIGKCGNLQGFKTKLDTEQDELGVLNDFYKLLLDVEKQGLFDNKNILPTQNGNFKKKPELFKDEGIDEILKDISSKLGKDVRNLLLHSKIFENVQNLLPPKKQDEVFNQIITLIKQPRSEDKQYLQANIQLFGWLLEHNKFEYFEGYPLLSSKEKIFTKLGKETKEKPLAPKDLWNEIARNYADLFPQEYIISSSYFEKVPEKDKWDKLENEKLILIDPLYEENEKVSQRDLDYLLLSNERLEEEKEHEAAEEVELSKIAFLETKDKGIIDSVRNSKEKARKFLGFLFDFVIENDTRWNTPVEVNCKCGSKHKIYPAFWIKVLKDREWVPLGRGKEEKLNSQYLASLIEKDKNLQQKCVQDKPSLLLSILNVSVGEVMMHIVAKDDKTKHELGRAMGSLYSTFMENPNQLNKIAELAASETELFIKEIEKHILTREQIRRNQSIGSLVETILKSVLEKEGFKVEITGVGSDFVVEHDFVKDNAEQILRIEKGEKICFYLEVKSAYQEFVRMTLTQAKEARDKSDRYILSVVRLDGLEINEENVKNNAKFVTDIGEKIRDKVSRAENLKEEQKALTEMGDIEIEISEGPIRLKINKKIWENGYTLEQFLAFLGCQKNK
jgi:hypothetical protein